MSTLLKDLARLSQPKPSLDFDPEDVDFHVEKATMTKSKVDNAVSKIGDVGSKGLLQGAASSLRAAAGSEALALKYAGKVVHRRDLVEDLISNEDDDDDDELDSDDDEHDDDNDDDHDDDNDDDDNNDDDDDDNDDDDDASDDGSDDVDGESEENSADDYKGHSDYGLNNSKKSKGAKYDDKEGDLDELSDDDDDNDDNDDANDASNGGADLSDVLQQLQAEEQQGSQLLSKSRKEDSILARCMKRQMEMLDDMYDCRIRMQVPLTASARLPLHPDRQLFIQSDCGSKTDPPTDFGSLYSSLVTESQSLVRDLLQIMVSCSTRTTESRRLFTGTSTASETILKRKNAFDSDNDCDILWAEVDLAYVRGNAFRQAVGNRWYEKTSITNKLTGGGSKFKSLGVTLLSDQIQQSLKQLPSMIHDSCKRLKSARPFGRVDRQTSSTHTGTEPIDMDSVPVAAPVTRGDLEFVSDPEVYDDSAAYQLVLREVIESGERLSDQMLTANKHWLALKSRKSRVIDRQSSKGRRVRYQVHPKLLNFIMPTPFDVPEVASELFKCLFGIIPESEREKQARQEVKRAKKAQKLSLQSQEEELEEEDGGFSLFYKK